MISLRAAILATTAVATLVVSVPAQAGVQFTSPYATKLSAYSDQEVLKRLVADYTRNPATFEAALEYIDLNRPSIREEYLTRTGAIAIPATGFGVAPLIAVGTAAAAAAYVMSQKDDEGAPDQPTPQPDPEPEDPVQGDAESFRTAEYNLNYGLRNINAASRYAMGAQGQGVKVSVLDTGIDTDHPEFIGKIDEANSYSYFENGYNYEDTHGHGTHVAGIIAAAKNDYGAHGVAFGSELVVLRGIPGLPGDQTTMSVSEVWSDAINRSVAADAAVMNNSWAYSRSDGNGGNEVIPITDLQSREELESFIGTQVISSMQYARDNDLLAVYATGNNAGDQVSVNAGAAYYLDEFQGYNIAVTATDEFDQIASFANRCGIAMDFCIAAPGVNIIAPAPGGDGIYRSGTSMAAPHVAGAAAVLKSQNPELTAPEISQIIFDTATDLGAIGVDEVYGHGLLNLGEAQAPQGNLVLYEGDSTNSNKIRLSDTGVIASSAMGAALNSALSGSDIMVGDLYDRGYYMSANSIVSAASAPLPGLDATKRSALNDEIAILSSSTGTGLEFKGDTYSYTLRRGSLSDSDGTSATSPLAFVSSDIGADYSVAMGSGLSLDLGISGAFGDQDHTAASVGFTADVGDGTIATRIGTLEERGTVLGSNFMGAAGKDGSARTAFVEVRGDFNLSDASAVSFIGTRSDTSFSQSGLITGGRSLAGTSGTVAFSQKGFLGTSGTLTASVSTPLQVTGGEITVDLPQQRVAATGATQSTGVIRSQSTVEFDVNQRPYDIGLSYTTDVAKSGLGVMMNAGYRAHGAASTPFAGLSVSLKF